LTELYSLKLRAGRAWQFGLLVHLPNIIQWGSRQLFYLDVYSRWLRKTTNAQKKSRSRRLNANNHDAVFNGKG
jgi:hypothetical protein